jgi:hypothetical protein
MLFLINFISSNDFMLKISQTRSANRGVTLRFKGRLVGPWIGEACKTCEKILAEGCALKLDLGGVDFADRDGVAFLNKLISSGVKLSGCSLFVEEQLKTSPNA